MKKTMLSLCCLILFSTVVFTQTTTPQQDVDPEIQKINEKYQAEYKRLEEHGRRLSDERPQGAQNSVGVDVDLSQWQTVTFGIPQFRMSTRKMFVDIPEVTMRIKRFVFSKPETRMKTVEIGKKPTFKGVKLTMRPIYANIPVTTMERHEVKISIPEIKMKQVEISVGVPEVFGTRAVSFRVPAITVRSTEETTDRIESEAEQIKKASDSLVAAESVEIKAHSKKRLLETRQAVEDQYKATVAQFTSAIEGISKAGGDPTRVSGEGGGAVNLVEQLAEASQEFVKALEQINAALIALDKP